MSTSMSDEWRRRDFLTRSALAGTAGLLGVRPYPFTAAPPPETQRIRLARVPTIRPAARVMTAELLHAEGITDVQYVSWPDTTQAGRATAAGEVDLTMQYVGPSILQLDAGASLVILAGVQPGCFELFGTERIRSIRDLRGKTIAV